MVGEEKFTAVIEFGTERAVANRKCLLLYVEGHFLWLEKAFTVWRPIYGLRRVSEALAVD